MIIPYYKKYGTSTHKLAESVGNIHNEKATHTGTLDPAAEGVVIVLTGEDRFIKQKLADAKKTYRAEVLFGISTDTHDMIGYPTDHIQGVSSLTEREIADKLSGFLGSYSQTQPDFSAQRVDGKSSFDLARSGVSLNPTQNDITIYSISTLSFTKVSISNLKEYHSSRLSLIQGDFRQQEVEERWKRLFYQLEKAGIHTLPLLTLEIECSKRTYIRALVRDLDHSLNTPATLYSLTRTQNGPYTIADCLCLV